MLVLEVVAVLLLLLALPLMAVAVRRRLLQRARRHGRRLAAVASPVTRPGLGAAGLGRFESDELSWYRVFSVAPGPAVPAVPARPGDPHPPAAPGR